jgi:hypothetical protein
VVYVVKAEHEQRGDSTARLAVIAQVLAGLATLVVLTRQR